MLCSVTAVVYIVLNVVTVMMFLATIFGLMLQSVVPAVPSEVWN